MRSYSSVEARLRNNKRRLNSIVADIISEIEERAETKVDIHQCGEYYAAIIQDLHMCIIIINHPINTIAKDNALLNLQMDLQSLVQERAMLIIGARKPGVNESDGDVKKKYVTIMHQVTTFFKSYIIYIKSLTLQLTSIKQ